MHGSLECTAVHTLMRLRLAFEGEIRGPTRCRKRATFMNLYLEIVCDLQEDLCAIDLFDVHSTTVPHDEQA